jgi:tRNA (mo5U34)-methyltransferase
MSGLEIHELAHRARQFKAKLEETKKQIPGIVWYPYDTFASLGIADKFLTGRNRSLLDLAAGDPILDLGCADGALSFFFESLGSKVHAVDHLPTNYNAMRGITQLRAALHSSIEVHAIDLDSQFYLPEESFGLVLCLGILYHLKNPFYLLESLAIRARYCLLSTRIAEVTPNGTTMKDQPLAYLLGPSEANNDPTNFWIFSEAGLRRICERTGWRIVDFTTIGCTRGSDPAHGDRDERAYCLLESRACPAYSVKLLEGWHPLEQNSFRWTSRQFSIELRKTMPLNARTFRLRFHLPEAVVRASGPITIHAKVNGAAFAPETFSMEGEYSYTIDLGRRISKGGPLRIDFTVDKALPAGDLDTRELALIVPFWRPDSDVSDPLVPFELV